MFFPLLDLPRNNRISAIHRAQMADGPLFAILYIFLVLAEVSLLLHGLHSALRVPPQVKMYLHAI